MKVVSGLGHLGLELKGVRALETPQAVTASTTCTVHHPPGCGRKFPRDFSATIPAADHGWRGGLHGKLVGGKEGEGEIGFRLLQRAAQCIGPLIIPTEPIPPPCPSPLYAWALYRRTSGTPLLEALPPRRPHFVRVDVPLLVLHSNVSLKECYIQNPNTYFFRIISLLFQ